MGHGSTGLSHDSIAGAIAGVILGLMVGFMTVAGVIIGLIGGAMVESLLAQQLGCRWRNSRNWLNRWRPIFLSNNATPSELSGLGQKIGQIAWFSLE